MQPHGDAVPQHWAPEGAPLSSCPSNGPPAGGDGDAAPYTSKLEWEWDYVTSTTAQCITSSSDQGLPTTHRGGCHCGAVRFEGQPPSRDLVAYDCNCSDCRMRRNIHFVVPADKLKFIEDAGGGSRGACALAEYRWGSGASRHLFCSRCGITPFYRPRSNPDGWGVTIQCLDPGTVGTVEIRRFDGRHWEVRSRKRRQPSRGEFGLKRSPVRAPSAGIHCRRRGIHPSILKATAPE